MATFSLTNSATQEISNLISTKPMLISKAELLSLGSNIKLVGYDPVLNLNSTINRSFSPRLINWVEPYEIKGILKSLLYRECYVANVLGHCQLSFETLCQVERRRIRLTREADENSVPNHLDETANRRVAAPCCHFLVMMICFCLLLLSRQTESC